jgi:hypothetical protein
MNEGRQASDAHPQAFAAGAAGNQHSFGLRIPAAEALKRGRVRFLFRDVFLNRLMRKGLGLAFFDGHRAFRANAKAEAGAVAQVFADQAGLAINDFDCALGAGDDARAASGAFFLIDTNYFPF